MSHGYSNFQNPLGLIKRMLLSKDRAARSALYRAGFAVLMQPLDRLLQSFEERHLREVAPTTLPIILIVGAPRSGTTLLYQTLARFLPVTYFTNFSALFPRAPITASRLFERFLGAKSFDDRNFYGNVAGLSAPNDGFHVWNRWLGADRYRAPQQLSEINKREMKDFFNAWLAAFGKPFINKNNRNTDCVALLASIFENACFVEVRRDPVYVAQSLLLARLHIQGSKEIGWGLRSRTGKSRKSYVDEVCEQVFDIEMKLRDDKQRLAPGRLLEVSYEQFCHDPYRFVQRISQEFLKREADETALRRELKPFGVTNAVRIENKEIERIRARLGELYGGEASTQFEGDSSTCRDTLSATLLA
jgi:hypothetical protein